MYYMLYIDQGMNRNLLFYARCNEDSNRKESEIVWTEKHYRQYAGSKACKLLLEGYMTVNQLVLCLFFLSCVWKKIDDC